MALIQWWCGLVILGSIPNSADLMMVWFFLFPGSAIGNDYVG